MKKFIKWSVLGFLGFCLLIIAALLLIPVFVDIQDHKPRLEAMVSEKTGRDFSIGGDLKLSLFPWAGIEFSDLVLGNPEGYQEENFVRIRSFDVQVKLIPLLTRNVEIKRFVIDGIDLALERSATGIGNWEDPGGSTGSTGERTMKAGSGDFVQIPIKSLEVGECAVKNGTVLWIDHQTGASHKLSDLNLDLRDVSLDRPILLSLSGVHEVGKLSMEGSVGPLGHEPGKDPIAFDISLKAFDRLDMGARGRLAANPSPVFDMEFRLDQFSPRKLLEEITGSFPIVTSDPGVLDRLAIKGSVKGSTEKISIRSCNLTLDDSMVFISLDAWEFEKPSLAYNIEIDSIDLDRYLPPPEEDQETDPGRPPKEEFQIDYSPLRKPVLDGTLRIGNLTVHRAALSDLKIKLAAENGRYEINPAGLAAYDGHVEAVAVVDLREAAPKASGDLTAEGIQLGDLLRDALEMDFLEGKLKTNISFMMSGDDAAAIKKTLNGKGTVNIQDGAIVGIDLAGMVRNIGSAFALSEKPDEKPRTDFAELNAPFTIENGIVNTDGTTMQSPFLRLSATGDANLVTEELDMRIEPKLVATITGQGDIKERSGIVVPVIVKGVFSKPEFRPDLKGMIDRRIEVPKAEDLKKILPDKKSPERESLKDETKDLLKSLPFRRN